MGHEQSNRQGGRGDGKRVEGVHGVPRLVSGSGFGTSTAGAMGVPVLSSKEIGGVLKLILELGTLGLDLEGLNWGLIDELNAVAKAAELSVPMPATLDDELAYLSELDVDDFEYDHGVADWVLHTNTQIAHQHTSSFARSNFDFEDEGWETCEDEPPKPRTKSHDTAHTPAHHTDIELERIYENTELQTKMKHENDTKMMERMKMKMRMVEAIKHMPMLNPEMRLVLTGVGRRAAEEGWNEAVMCGLLVLCFLRLFLLDGIA